MQTLLEKPCTVEKHLTQKWRDWIDADLFGEEEFLGILHQERYQHLIELATTMRVKARTYTAELEELAWSYGLCKHCMRDPDLIAPPLWVKKLWPPI